MPKHDDPSDSEHEETPENSSSDSEEAGKPSNGQQQNQVGGMPEYEKQRLARIAENRARMEALGLPKMASSLMGSAQNVRNKNKEKGKAKVLEDDDDYRPEEEGPSSSSEEEAIDDYDEDYLDEKSSGARKKKVISLYLMWVSGDFATGSRSILLCLLLLVVFEKDCSFT